MITKVSKAQLEVWEWKEKAYHQIKDMPFDNAIQFIINETQEIVDRIRNGQNKRKKAKKH